MNEKFQVFDSREFPQNLVRPELSDLGESPSVAKEFEQKYPNLTFAKACLVDGNVLICDIAPLEPERQEIMKLCQRLGESALSTVQVVEAWELTCDLLKIFSDFAFLFGKSPLVLYPGEAGKIVKQYISLTIAKNPDRRLDFLLRGYSVPTQRKQSKPGKFEIDLDLTNLPEEIKNDSVVLIDDVVATGTTARTIAEKIGERMPKMPFYLASWLFVRPSEKENQKSPAGVTGFERSFCTLALKGNYTQRPPINSLSCFIRDDEKGLTVKENYFSKYVWDTKKFKQQLEAIKRIRRSYG